MRQTVKDQTLTCLARRAAGSPCTSIPRIGRTCPSGAEIAKQQQNAQLMGQKVTSPIDADVWSTAPEKPAKGCAWVPKGKPLVGAPLLRRSTGCGVPHRLLQPRDASSSRRSTLARSEVRIGATFTDPAADSSGRGLHFTQPLAQRHAANRPVRRARVFMPLECATAIYEYMHSMRRATTRRRHRAVQPRQPCRSDAPSTNAQNARDRTPPAVEKSPGVCVCRSRDVERARWCRRRRRGSRQSSRDRPLHAIVPGRAMLRRQAPAVHELRQRSRGAGTRRHACRCARRQRCGPLTPRERVRAGAGGRRRPSETPPPRVCRVCAPLVECARAARSAARYTSSAASRRSVEVAAASG